MVSNERLDVLFRKDDPTRDSPLAGLDPLPVQLDLSPVKSCAQIVQQRLASTSLDITQFADLFVVPCQPKALLDRCAARYDVLYQTDEPATIFSLCPTAQQATLTLESF